MKVYLVYFAGDGQYSLECIKSSRQKAEEFIDTKYLKQYYEIEVWDVDE